MKMKPKKLPPSSNPTAFAAATVRSRKTRSGINGDSTRVSTTRNAPGADAAPEAERLIALGALREHVHHDRERRRQDDGSTEALQSAHRDQKGVGRRQPRTERCRGEESKPEHEDAPSSEQIRSTTSEQQEAAERQPVGGHNPLQVRLREVELAADRRQ